MTRAILLHTCCLLFSLINAQPPNIKFQHLSVKDGLSRSWVKCIYQDSDGFLWFGTEDGLNKYNGYDFKVYKHNSQLQNSLNNNNINTVYEDQENNIWVGTQDGLNKYDPNKDEFIPSSINHNYIKCAHVFENGIHLLGTAVGLYTFNPTTQSTKIVHKDTYILDILMDRENNCWLATMNGLVLLNTSDYTHKTIPLPGNKDTSADDMIHKLFQDSKGRIWIGTNSWGLYLMEYPASNPANPTFHQFAPDPFNQQSVSQGAIYALKEDNNNNLWVGTEHGGLNLINLNNFKKENCSFNSYSHNPYDLASISHNSIHDIYIDKQNTVWVGVYSGGINYYNELNHKFSHINQDPNNPNSLSNNSVNVIYEEEDFIWIGTEKGLNVYNKKTKNYKYYIHNHQDENSIGSNAIWAIFRDSRGLLWIGTWGGGLNLFNEKNQTFTRYLHNENNSNTIGGNNIFDIIEDKNGYLWIASMLGGLNKFDYKTQKFTSYKYKKDENILSTDWVVQVHESSNGELWVATTIALDLFNRKTGTSTTFKNIQDDIKSISSNGVNTILEDIKNNIWLGTNNGLNLFHRKDSSFSYFQVNEGLPNNSIKAIIEDDNGNLWLSTGNGLAKFVNGIHLPEKPTFINYDISDGLQSNEFTGRSACKGKDGKLYFGGSNGYNVFYPDMIKENTFIPEVVFSDFLIFNNSVSLNDASSPIQQHINNVKEIKLKRDQNVFSIEYAALNYISPEKNEYAYKLEGFEDNWNFVGTKRVATYTNLNHGKYIFKIKASNNHGIWNQTGKEVLITILPAWWQTKVAKLIFILVLLIALYLFRKYTIISTTLKNKLWLEYMDTQKTEELNNLKFQFFTNISHELRTPLTLISGPVNQLIKKDYAKKELHLIKNNVSRLLILIDQILDFRKVEADTMQLNEENIDIVETIKDSFFNFASFAEQKKIRLVFNSSLEKLYINADKDKVHKITTNIVSNAINNTPETGTITLKINIEADKSEKNKQLKISISDTGKGISNKNINKIFDRFFTLSDGTGNISGSGIGLHLTKKLVEIQNGTINVKSTLEQGSEFIINYPLKKAKITPNNNEPVETKSVYLEEDKPIAKGKTEPYESTILIIDDNADICIYLKSLLGNSYNIFTETNPSNGMNKILEILPDIIISDVMMPKIDGFELCKKIKTDIRFSHIPVILLTAKATTKDRITGFEIGADEYIYKPFDNDLLTSRIANLLSQRKQLKNHFIGTNGIIDAKYDVNELDKKFIEKVISIIKQQYTNQDFNINKIIDEIGMSKSVFYRKFKSLSNHSINDLIKNYRLKMAKELLKNNFNNISEIAFDCGFKDPAYFSKVFKEQYKISPRDYQKTLL